MSYEYSELDEGSARRLNYDHYEQPDLMDIDWWTPDGIMPIIEWSLTQCPWYIRQLTGEMREGAYGPGTCMGGCVDEPRCTT